MTIPQFIEKAIEGGWNDKPYRAPTYEGADTVWSHYESLFLDPLAWQAVGKVEGWEDTKTYWTMQAKGTAITLLDAWECKMHDFIQARIEGKTIEEFLETL